MSKQRKGIDVSYHQGVIDWGKVASDGIEFAIIRAGYGKSTMDKKFIENICSADKAGLEIGIYWFIYAADVSDAIANADKCNELIQSYKNIITFKVWADWEYDSDKRNPQTKASRTAITKAFCERMESHGYDVGVYANPDYITSKFNMQQLNQYPLWLARYAAEKGEYEPFIWQHTSKGSVKGIAGNVDMNIAYCAETDSKVEFYEVPQFTLLDCLAKVGVNVSFKNRTSIAAKNGIVGYTGTKEQNLLLLEKLKAGILIK